MEQKPKAKTPKTPKAKAKAAKKPKTKSAAPVTEIPEEEKEDCQSEEDLSNPDLESDVESVCEKDVSDIMALSERDEEEPIDLEEMKQYFEDSDSDDDFDYAPTFSLKIKAVAPPAPKVIPVPKAAPKVIPVPKAKAVDVSDIVNQLINKAFALAEVRGSEVLDQTMCDDMTSTDMSETEESEVLDQTVCVDMLSTVVSMPIIMEELSFKETMKRVRNGDIYVSETFQRELLNTISGKYRN